MDIVYILKEGVDDCLELRYSLRSLSNINHGKVFIIGYKPKWVKNIIHIEAEDPFEIKSLNALHKINIACKYKRISDDFVLMNDDFYITEPTEIKYYHQGLIQKHFLKRKTKGQNGNYVNNLHKTYCLFPDGLDYSLHYPIIFNKSKFLDLQNHYNMEQGYLLRNLYCNHYKVGGEQAEDCKIININDIPEKMPTFISNLDCLIVSEEFKAILDNLFPKTSKYESS